MKSFYFIDPQILRIQTKKIIGRTKLKNDEKQYFFQIYHISDLSETKFIKKSIIDKNSKIQQNKSIFKYKYIFEQNQKQLKDICQLEKGTYLIMVSRIHSFIELKKQIKIKKQFRAKVEMMVAITKAIVYLYGLQFYKLRIDDENIIKDSTHQMYFRNIFQYEIKKISIDIVVVKEKEEEKGQQKNEVENGQQKDEEKEEQKEGEKGEQQEEGEKGEQQEGQQKEEEKAPFESQISMIQIDDEQKQAFPQVNKEIILQKLDIHSQKVLNLDESSIKYVHQHTKSSLITQSAMKIGQNAIETNSDSRYIWILAFIFAEIDIQEHLGISSQQKFKEIQIQQIRQFILKKGRYADTKMNESVSTLIYHMIKPQDLRISLANVLIKLEKLLVYIRRHKTQSQVQKYGLLPLINSQRTFDLYKEVNGPQNQRLFILNEYQLFLFYNISMQKLIVEIIHNNYLDPIVINHFTYEDLPKNIQQKFSTVRELFEYLKELEFTCIKLTANGFLAFYIQLES